MHSKESSMLFSIFIKIYEIFQILLFIFLFLVTRPLHAQKIKKFLLLRNPILFMNQINKISASMGGFSGEVFWFHISSAGELEQAIPIARKLSEKSGVKLFLTYYSPSAEPFLKNFPPSLGCIPLPLDLSLVYRYIFKKINITNVFFVRYDLWPAFIYAVESIKPLKPVSLHLLCASKNRTKSDFFSKLSENFINYLYSKFDKIYPVTKEDESFFLTINKKSQIILAGDAKWARAIERAKSKIKSEIDPIFFSFLKICAELSNTKKIVIFASPHKEEHEFLISLSQFKENFFFIYVPHHTDELSVSKIYQELSFSSFSVSLYSSLSIPIELLEHNVMIFDKMGFLAELYQVAHLAVIGGGFDGQIHNVLEAAAHGVPTVFGPNFKRAHEVNQLLNQKGAMFVNSPSELFHFFASWVNFSQDTAFGSAAVCEETLQLIRQNAMLIFEEVPPTSDVVFENFTSKTSHLS